MLVGGHMFYELWYEEGSPFGDGARIVHIDDSERDCAQNYHLEVGLLADTKAALRSILLELNSRSNTEYRGAAAQRTANSKSAVSRFFVDEQPKNPIVQLALKIREALPKEPYIVHQTVLAGEPMRELLAPNNLDAHIGEGGNGGLGHALPFAIGVKLAYPNSPVLALSSDGSAMFNIQALWTAARYNLQIVNIILKNQKYAILEHSLVRSRERHPGPWSNAPTQELIRLAPPPISYVDVARGLGLNAKVVRPSEITPAVKEAFASPGPSLLEVPIDY